MALQPGPAVLYNPRATHATLPLALLSIARALRTAHLATEIIDARLDPAAHRRLAAMAGDAAVVGVTSVSGAPLADAAAASRLVAAQHPHTPVIWGGWHASLCPTQPIEQAGATATVQGAGETPMVTIAQRLREGQPLAGIPGVTARTPEGGCEATPADPLPDMNQWPMLPYDLLPMERYFEAKGQRQLDYISSQGCRFRCGFCADPTVYQRAWTGLAPERVVQELAYLAKRYAITDVAFQDETFFTSAPRVLAIAEGLLQRDTRFSWAATIRADQGSRLSPDAFHICRRAGLRRVMVGLEAASQPMLDQMHKDITLDQLFTLADRCRDAGIALLCNLIVGFPGEPPESIEATLAAALRLRAYGPEFQIAVFHYRPYPGTPITEAARRDGYQLPDSIDAWAAIDDGPAPWTDTRTATRVARFMFYQRIGWARRSLVRAPLQAVARWRCRTNRYGWPIEAMALSRRVHGGPAL